jgi:nucleoside-diphosphate-sugar epimerase
MKTILIAGCGFVGRAALPLFQQAGWKVTALTRSQASAREIESAAGCRAVACDLTQRSELEALNLSGFDAVVDCVSAGGGDTEEYRRIYFEGAGNLLDVLSPKRFLFTSSSSIYGQDDGSVVTEESPACPETGTGLVLRSTEELVLARGGMVARFTGIYGPGRAMLLRRFLEGSAVLEGDGSRHLNQIHRDDAAAAVFFLLNRDGATGVFNVTDNASPTQREFYGWLAEHFGRPLPPSGAADPRRRRFATNKRVSNEKLRALGWEPTHPSFLHALRNDPDLLKM